jgi:hypothetical protein
MGIVAVPSSTTLYYRIATTVAAGYRQVIIETDQLPGCPSCGVISSRRKERRFQRLRDIPVAGTVDGLWSKYRWYCEEPACDRLSFFESTPQVPLRGVLVDGPGGPERGVSAAAARRGEAQSADAGHR